MRFRVTAFASRFFLRHRWALWALWIFGVLAVQPAHGQFRNNTIVGFEILNFRAGDGTKTFLEIFCKYPTDDLIFVKYSGGFFASYKLTVAIEDFAGTVVSEKSVVDSVKVQTFKEKDLPRSPKLIRFSFMVDPGHYQAVIRWTDLETRKTLQVAKAITVPDFSRPDLEVSDLQVAASIHPTQEHSILVKNNMKIVPNIPRIFGPELNVLYVYYEIYNLQYAAADANGEFITTYIIKDSKGREVRSFKRTFKKPGTSCAQSAGISVATLEPGPYQLTLIVEDPQSAQRTQKSTQFFVVKPASQVNL